MNLDPYHAQILTIWVIDLNVKGKTNFLEESLG